MDVNSGVVTHCWSIHRFRVLRRCSSPFADLGGRLRFVLLRGGPDAGLPGWCMWLVTAGRVVCCCERLLEVRLCSTDKP